MPPSCQPPLHSIDLPAVILNGKSDAANQKVARLLEEIPTARFAACEGDYHSTPYGILSPGGNSILAGAMAPPDRVVEAIRP